MNERAIGTASYDMLAIKPEQLEGIGQHLGVDGSGVFNIPEAVDPVAHEALLTEMKDPTRVIWTDAGDEYVNARGVRVVQNHTVFALKLSRGDQAPVENVPQMRQLGRDIEQLVRGLSPLFGSLVEWTADEMSYHEYYGGPEGVGLSPHKDNKRFNGLIAIATIENEGDFQVVHRTPLAYRYNPEIDAEEVVSWDVHSTLTVPTRPRTLTLLRATGLIPEGPGDDFRPEHAVVNAPERRSFMLRANTLPDDLASGFHYYNWGNE